MATGKCLDCGKEVSEEAKACPHCGKPMPLMSTGTKSTRIFVAGTLAFFLGPVGLWYQGHWAAGFAWLAVGIGLAFAGLGIVAGLIVWIGMFLHAVFVDPR